LRLGVNFPGVPLRFSKTDAIPKISTSIVQQAHIRMQNRIDFIGRQTISTTAVCAPGR
jgi:hypothetical protein